jgi:hypothetical protein
VVAVNKASSYGTATPVEELMGRARRMLPSKIKVKKLSMMVRVVDKDRRDLAFLCVVISMYRSAV